MDPLAVFALTEVRGQVHRDTERHVCSPLGELFATIVTLLDIQKWLECPCSCLVGVDKLDGLSDGHCGLSVWSNARTPDHTAGESTKILPPHRNILPPHNRFNTGEPSCGGKICLDFKSKQITLNLSFIFYLLTALLALLQVR